MLLSTPSASTTDLSSVETKDWHSGHRASPNHVSVTAWHVEAERASAKASIIVCVRRVSLFLMVCVLGGAVKSELFTPTPTQQTTTRRTGGGHASFRDFCIYPDIIQTCEHPSVFSQ